MKTRKKTFPAKLSEKLKSIRRILDLTQSEMVALVKPEAADVLKVRTYISEFESGRRLPSLIEVYNYAKAVRNLTQYKDFSSDDIIGDERKLPWN